MFHASKGQPFARVSVFQNETCTATLNQRILRVLKMPNEARDKPPPDLRRETAGRLPTKSRGGAKRSRDQRERGRLH